MRAITTMFMSLFLASCVVPASTGPAPTSSSGITYAEVKALAVQGCSYVPTIAEVTSLIPQFATAASIAQGMCSVLKAVGAKRGARRGVSPPMLKGVPLEGHFEP